MGQSFAACSGPARPPYESDSGAVTDVLGDARLLADYVVFLQETGKEEALQDLWDLELGRDDPVEVEKISEALESSWQAYNADPTGKGNFDDTREWSPHDLPESETICRTLSQKTPDAVVNEEDKQYFFAVAAMVGLHVATVCSAIIDKWRKQRHPTEDDYDAMAAEAECARRYKIPVGGSAYSPKTILREQFEIEEFAPAIFSDLRKLAGVTDQDYMGSLCRIDFEFIKFGANSKSNEFFFFSHDKKFLLKTTTAGEALMLLNMLPDFKERFLNEPRSMLGRYFGLYRLTQGSTSRLFFIMRANLGCNHAVRNTYDLKGSTMGRLAKPHESVGKDLNFKEEVGRLSLARDVAEELVDIYQQDVELLLEHRIMDYSLLLQICGIAREEQDGRSPPMVSIGSRSGRLVGAHADGGGGQAVPVVRPAQMDNDPHAGIESADGKSIYFFCLIDILVAFDMYPKANYALSQVQSCGHGDTASRIPADMYCERQLAMFKRICGADG